jgi:hypothetical protein
MAVRTGEDEVDTELKMVAVRTNTIPHTTHNERGPQEWSIVMTRVGAAPLSTPTPPHTTKR